MPGDLEALLLRKGVGAMLSGRETCRGCGRTPLAGELVWLLENGIPICSLCRGRLPESRREGARPERVHVGARPLRVSRRAA